MKKMCMLEPEVEIICLDAQDVIATSGGDNGLMNFNSQNNLLPVPEEAPANSKDFTDFKWADTTKTSGQ